MKYDIKKIRQAVKNNSCSGLDCRECPVSSYNSPNGEYCNDALDFKKLRLWLQKNDKEQTMNVKQMTEDDFRNLLQESASQTKWSASGLMFTYEINDSIIIRKAKEKGYIKQTDLEKAKEEYHDLYRHEVPTQAYNYIKELIKEVDRLKGK